MEKITHEIVRDAIERFRKKGGFIKLLPPQISTGKVVMGVHFGIFEQPFDFEGIELESVESPKPN